MQSRARGGDDLRTATIDALYNDVDYTDPDFWVKLMPAAVASQGHEAARDLASSENLLDLSRRRRKGVERLGFGGSPDLSGKASDSDSGSGYGSCNGGGGDRQVGGASRGGKVKKPEGEYAGPQWGVGDLKAAKKKLLDVGYGRWGG